MVVTCDFLPAVSWAAWPGSRPDNELAVFRIPVAGNVKYAPQLYPLLQAEEVRRARQYHRPADHCRFLIARAALRILLGKYTDQPPAAIRFAPGINQKPVLENAPGPHFTISHSEDWILLAIAGVEVGIDVEKTDPLFPFEAVLPHYFSPPEQAFIARGPASRHLFYQAWTRKEALAKATAQGIDADFGRLPALDGRHHCPGPAGCQTEAWVVSSFAAAAGYAAALAYPAAIRRGAMGFYEVGESLFRPFA